eukprot:scaffold797_cov236-Pinguiococcus_pyrenoidosus.AAC.10
MREWNCGSTAAGARLLEPRWLRKATWTWKSLSTFDARSSASCPRKARPPSTPMRRYKCPDTKALSSKVLAGTYSGSGLGASMSCRSFLSLPASISDTRRLISVDAMLVRRVSAVRLRRTRRKITIPGLLKQRWLQKTALKQRKFSKSVTISQALNLNQV